MAYPSFFEVIKDIFTIYQVVFQVSLIKLSFRSLASYINIINK